MHAKVATLAALAATALLIAGCSREEQPAAVPSAEASDHASEAAVAQEASTADASGPVTSALASQLDMEALKERRDPERLLRFYTNAIRIGAWANAARAWSLDAQMTSEKLEKQFGGDAGPKIAVGKGDMSGAAGSLYYEAPIVVDFADGRPSRRGSIVLRRVNDVPGASEQQLNWRIERTSTLSQ